MNETKTIKVDESQFTVIWGHFRKKHNLKGNELIVYSVIYGFSQGENHWYHGSRAYLADWTGTSKQTISGILDSLIEKKLIVKRVEYENGIRKCFYRAVELLNVSDQLTYNVISQKESFCFDILNSEHDG